LHPVVHSIDMDIFIGMDMDIDMTLDMDPDIDMDTDMDTDKGIEIDMENGIDNTLSMGHRQLIEQLNRTLNKTKSIKSIQILQKYECVYMLN
jgi:hypothetical protein